MDYAKNLIAGDTGHPGPEGPPESELPEWCLCGVCRPMPTPEKNKCCGKRTCVTSYELFQNICIDREVLTVAIRARCDIRVEEPDAHLIAFEKLHTANSFYGVLVNLVRETERIAELVQLGLQGKHTQL